MLHISELYPLLDNFKNVEVSEVKKQRKTIEYLHLYSGFDIETTNLINGDNKRAYMYIWQVSFNHMAYCGRTWEEFTDLLKILKYKLKLTITRRIIIWVANLSFEFQFFRKLVNVTDIFAKEKRQPLLIVIDDCIEFRECLSLSGGSLEQLAKDYTKTQKMVGDLDYKLKRNKFTKLTTNELGYCENDVIILSEWSEYFFNTYIVNGKIPMTKTSVLRGRVKDSFIEWCGKFGKFGVKKMYNYIRSLCPKTIEEYKYLMDFLFRGGYTHGNILYTGDILENIKCFDFVSSYPSVMQQAYFPMTPFIYVKNCTLEELEKLCCENCVYFLATFYNLNNTTSHSIESTSKTLELENPVIDNGRILSATKITVLLTELDYLNYKDFYIWDNMTIEHVHIAERGKLPSYLIDNLLCDYCTKAQLKIDGKGKEPIYNITKASVNSYYGMTVTRLVDKDVKYINGEWYLETQQFNYIKAISRLTLSPFWGIYVTAHARRNELSMLKKMHKYCVYCDTDSLFVFDNDETQQIINEWNVSRETFNKQYCEKYNYSYELLGDLGTMEEDKICEKFKFLGAKRYIYSVGNRTYNTIAGLKKNISKDKSMIERIAEIENKNCYDVFTNNMYVSCDESKKLASAYIDDYVGEFVTDYLGNTCYMEEESCVCLYDIDFTMTLSREYMDLILKYMRRSDRRV